jgi:putative flavoprotein involved in K+ transport
MNTERHDVVIIGAGGAGLATSYFLTKLGIEHIVLERGIVGNTWAAERWDSFHLVNPNWAVRLPSFEYGGEAYGGKDPDGYLSRSETVDYLRRYADHIGAHVRTGVEVKALSEQEGGYELQLGENGSISCRAVVVATGAFGPPKAPTFASQIPASINQIHSAQYKNADQLPAGAILVVGSGQSGAQIAEDLWDAGRRVYLSVSKAGRRPRRYRGRDSSWWMRELGYFERNLDNIDDATRERIRSGGGTGSGHVGGGKGGHDIYLRAFCRGGMVLLGSLVGAHGYLLDVQQNLLENLRIADDAAISFRRTIDEHIERTAMDLPLEENPDPPGLDGWPEAESPDCIDLAAEGITSIVWATGFGYNYDWIEFPVGDERGYPIQRRGVSQWPGLYFMGLQWMYGSNSAQFYGVHEDARYVAEHIADSI